MSRQLHWLAGQGGPLLGTIAVPGDKSVSHRAVMFAALADGVTQIEGFLEGEDTRATAAIFARLGVRIETTGPSTRLVHGVGLHGLRAPDGELDCGNAGTGMRLLAGLLSGQAFDSVLVGDESLSRRPMRRVVEPLAAMAAVIGTGEGGTAPLRIRGGQALTGIDYDLPVASAQVKSAILLAGLYAAGVTRVREPHPTRDYTESMLRTFGVAVGDRGDGWIELCAPPRLVSPGRIVVPGDFSSAAFFLVGASIVPGSDLVIEGVGINPRRTGLLDVLLLMGADITVHNPRDSGGEPVADLRVRSAPLRGIVVPADSVPDMIDEFPVLFVAAALAEGETVITDAAELRVKESDRIAVMAAGLAAMGIVIEQRPDGAVIQGGRPRGDVTVASAGDHRCAMALAVAAQRADAPLTIGDCANVATSFPDFVSLARAIGMDLAEGTPS